MPQSIIFHAAKSCVEAGILRFAYSKVGWVSMSMVSGKRGDRCYVRNKQQAGARKCPSPHLSLLLLAVFSSVLLQLVGHHCAWHLLPLPTRLSNCTSFLGARMR